MSIEKMAAVLHHSNTSGSTKLVLIGIANHDGDGGAWCSTTTLARYANVERRQVKKILRDLEEIGELVTIPRTGLTNLYSVNVECPENCDRTFQHRLGGGVLHDTGVLQDTGGGVLQDTRGVSHRTPEPNITQILNQPENDEQFSKFWELYPRKAARPAALKAFATIDPTEITSLMLSLTYWLESPSFPTDEKYIPYPVTWLNKRPWHDLHQTRERTRERQERERAAYLERIAQPDPEPVRCYHNLFPRRCPQCGPQLLRGVDWDTLVKPTTEKETT
jgi:hypothetical protein